MKNAMKFLLGLFVLLWAQSAYSQSTDQFVFFAKSAPAAASEALVLLRWDLLEGRIPDDVQSYRLLRDGEQIAELPVAGRLSPAAVDAHYAQPEFFRQRAEMLFRMQQLAQGPVELGGGFGPVTAANLSQVLMQRLASDSFFASQAPRQDIVLAAAMHRGFIDRPVPGVHQYELRAVGNSGQSARLGRATVDTARETTVSAAAGFSQIRLGRCDAPEGGLDHGAVILDWRFGGANASEVYANSLQTAGFELWRTIEALEPGELPPLIDLALATQGAVLSSSGTPVVAGIRRAIPDLIVLPGANIDANAPLEAEFTQNSAELRAQNMRPGERYAYYLAPRDFSGAYGPTVPLVVTIPDLLPPPSPWNVEVVESNLNSSLALEWDAVDVNNYLRTRRFDRQFCNLETARREGRLFYAPGEQSCGDGTEIGVNLQVAEYRVYRFDDFDAASRFVDSDGDGYGDLEERDGQGNTGMACDAALFPPGGTSARVDSEDQPQALEAADGRAKFRFVDPNPVPGQVHWYRVAAMGANGELGRLSAPQRAVFHDRSLPEAPAPDDIVLTGPERCDLVLRINERKGEPGVILYNSENRNATRARFSCGDRIAAEIDFAGTPPAASAVMDENGCDAADAVCGNAQPVLAFFDGESVLAQLSSPDLHACQSDVFLETLECVPGGPIPEDDWLDEPPPINGVGEECVALYREVGDEVFRIGNSCDEELDLGNQNFPEGERICLSVAYQDENGRTSPRARLPCFYLNEEEPQRPPPPSPISLSYFANDGNLSWLLPEFPVGGTLIELRRQGGGDDSVVRGSVAHPDGRDDGQPQLAVLELPDPLDPQGSEEWCMTLKAVGVAPPGQTSALVSEPSAPLCGDRGGLQTDYLGWPKVDLPPNGETLETVYLELDQAPLVRLAPASELLDGTQGCTIPEIPPCDEKSCLQERLDVECKASAVARFCASVRSDIAGQLDFVAYRQSRDPASPVDTVTDFIQVSPLIEGVFCERQLPEDCDDGNCPAVASMNDPFVGLVNLGAEFGQAWETEQFVFVDSFPHVAAEEYRYQFVYFNSRGEIEQTRTSGWLSAQPLQP